MFDKEYTFSGKHATMVKKLTAQFGSDSSNKLFPRNVDVYILAPLIGFLFGRKAVADNSNEETTKIFPEQLIKEAINLKYSYQLIMLLHDKNISFDDRLDKAFRNYGNKENTDDEQLFNSYVLGGVEVLYEKLIEKSTVAENYLTNLYDFLEEFDSRFNNSISADSIIDLCHLAKI